MYTSRAFSSQLLFGGLMLAITGCGATEVRCYPVTGTVTVQHRPAAGAVVILHPRSDDPRLKTLRPYGTVDSAGRFSLNCLSQDDGAPAGEYAVTIQWEVADAAPGATDDPESAQPVQDRLQGRYSNPETAILKVTVREEPTELPPFAL